MMITEKLGKLKNKGPGFYLNIQINKIKRSNRFFGWFFQKFYKDYTIGDLNIYVGKDLFPLPLYSRFLFKIYENEEMTLLKKYLKGDESVLELGACLGVVSCKANTLLNNPKNQISIEANPELIPHLEKNKNKNGCEFKILNGIVSNQKEVKFYLHDAAFSGSMHKTDNYRKEVSLPGFTPQEVEKKYDIDFDTLIMDIEGGEFEFIKTYTSWLLKLNMLLIEFHPNRLSGDQKITEYFRILEEHCGFELVESLNGSHIFIKR